MERVNQRVVMKLNRHVLGIILFGIVAISSYLMLDLFTPLPEWGNILMAIVAGFLVEFLVLRRS